MEAFSAFGHFQVVLGSVQSHHISFGAVNTRYANGIAMHADKQVGVVPVGNGRALIQFDKHVRFAGKNNLNLREFRFNEGANFSTMANALCFSFDDAPMQPGVFATMTGIKYNFFYSVSSGQ